MQLVACPQCKQETDLSPANPWRPFCCERCKLIDLGEWFDETNSIAADNPQDWTGAEDGEGSSYQ